MQHNTFVKNVLLILSVIYHLIQSILAKSGVWNLGNSEEKYLELKPSDQEEWKC